MLTILPWYPLTPNLACTNEATPRGESPEAIRPDPDGHPAERPTATRPRLRGHDRARTRSHTRARTRSHTRGLHNDVTHTSDTPDRTGWRRGTLVYSLPAGPGQRPWARRPGKKKKKRQDSREKKGTFGRRYVSAHPGAKMISPELHAVLIRFDKHWVVSMCLPSTLSPLGVREPLETHPYS